MSDNINGNKNENENENKTLAKYDITNSLGVTDINKLLDSISGNINYYLGDMTYNQKLLFSAYLSSKGYLESFINSTVNASNYLYTTTQDNISYVYDYLYDCYNNYVYDYLWGNSNQEEFEFEIVNEYGIFDDIEQDIIKIENELNNSNVSYYLQPFNSKINEKISNEGISDKIMKEINNEITDFIEIDVIDEENYEEENYEENYEEENYEEDNYEEGYYEENYEEIYEEGYYEENYEEEENYFEKLLNDGETNKQTLFYAYYCDLIKRKNKK